MHTYIGRLNENTHRRCADYFLVTEVHNCVSDWCANGFEDFAMLGRKKAKISFLVFQTQTLTDRISQLCPTTNSAYLYRAKHTDSMLIII